MRKARVTADFETFPDGPSLKTDDVVEYVYLDPREPQLALVTAPFRGSSTNLWVPADLVTVLDPDFECPHCASDDVRMVAERTTKKTTWHELVSLEPTSTSESAHAIIRAYEEASAITDESVYWRLACMNCQTILFDHFHLTVTEQ